MNIQFLKDLSLIDGKGKEYHFKHYGKYKLPDVWTKELISQGYAFELGYMNEVNL